MATLQTEVAEEEVVPLQPNQLCMATQDFDGPEDGDLPFKQGDLITIVQACDIMFWYVGKNSKGEAGIVPRNFLEPIHENHKDQVLSGPPPTPGYMDWEREQVGGDYLDMHPANNTPSLTTNPLANTGLQASVLDSNKMDSIDLEMLIMQEKEKRRRLCAGTLVMGNCQFPGDQPGDLPFNVYDEMTILHPMKDLCWYFAQKTDHPERKGAIPITHVRLVYMSDDEDDEEQYKAPTKPAHDRLYDDVNDFLSQSGWFSYPGLAHGKKALQHVLAKKMKLSIEDYMGVREAVYMLNYRQGEKVYVGKAKVLHDDICKHFECFDKKREEISEIDDELCHHTDMSGWEITVWPLQPDQNLEVEWAKKNIEHDALNSREERGLTEDMRFTSTTSFDKFWDWFAPN